MRIASALLLATALPLLVAAPAFADPVDDAARQEGANVSQGAPQLGSFYKGTEEKTDWYVEMKVGQCYWIAGAGSEKVEELSLYLWNPSDDRVADNTHGKQRVSLLYCPPDPGMYRFQAKVAEGSGPYSVAIFSKPGTPMERKKGLIGGVKSLFGGDKPAIDCKAGLEACDGKCVDLKSDLLHCGKCGNDCKKGEEVCRAGVCEDNTDLDALLEQAAKQLAPGTARVGEAFSGNAKTSDWFTQMDQGKCYFVVAVGGRKTKDLYLYLWNGDNKRLAENRSGGAKTSVAHCANQTGMYKFQAKLNKGDGPYKAGVYVKK